MPSRLTAPSPLRQGLAAARANLLPGLILQAVALAVLLAYYFWPAARAGLEEVAALKERYGYGFSMVSTAIAGGLLPILFQQAFRTPDARQNLKALPFFILFWGWKGAEVDLLYRTHATLFGDDAALLTILYKSLVDQFVYVPFWAVPTMVLGYLWRESGYSFRELRRRLGSQWYRRRGLPVLLSNWGVWIPVVAIIYALPAALQVPLQNLALCLWVLMLLYLTSRHVPEASAESARS
jgi:hypothetical protein